MSNVIWGGAIAIVVMAAIAIIWAAVYESEGAAPAGSSVVIDVDGPKVPKAPKPAKRSK